MKYILLISLLSLGLTALTGQTATILQTGHVDLDFNYDDGWKTGVHHDAAGHLETDEAIFYLTTDSYPSGSAISRPTGSQWDFIGVDAGETFYLVPQTQQSAIVWPGFASEETTGGTLASYSEVDSRVTATAARWITISLLSVQYYGEGTGAFSLWSTGGFGEATVWMSTADGGVTSDDKFLFLEGGHTHLNWGFGDEGFYEITLQASAYLNDGSMTYVQSDPITFQFGVGTTVIPEPSTWLLLILGTGFLVFLMNRIPSNTKGKTP